MFACLWLQLLPWMMLRRHITLQKNFWSLSLSSQDLRIDVASSEWVLSFSALPPTSFLSSCLVWKQSERPECGILCSWGGNVYVKTVWATEPQDLLLTCFNIRSQNLSLFVSASLLWLSWCVHVWKFRLLSYNLPLSESEAVQTGFLWGDGPVVLISQRQAIYRKFV